MVDTIAMHNTININSKFESCLIKLEKLKDKILIVTDKKGQLLGTITDGDIRRYILKKRINRKITEVMNKKPKFIRFNKKINYEELKKKFLNITYLPVVDKNKKYLYFLNLKKNEELKKTAVLIMAGGKGKRLYPLTKKIPKPMLLINQKPQLINLLSTLQSQGFENFYVSVNYKKSKIINPLNKFSKQENIKINFVKEKKFLGTAGSIGLLKNIYNDYLVINSDIVTTLNFKNLIYFHTSKKSDFTICTKTFENKIPFGLLSIKNNKIISISEKPTLHHDFCCGIYVLNEKILKFIKKNEYIDMPDLIKNSTKKNINIFPYMVHEYWKDIGDKKNLIELNEFYLKYFL